MATVIYGSEIAKEVKANLKEKVAQLANAGKRLPKLVVILVGDNPASLSYVTGKEKACKEVGMDSDLIKLPAETTQTELEALIQQLNEDDNVDGILVQLPLPKHLDEDAILEKIDPSKDVDGFHPTTVGNMCIGSNGFLPCTPAGVIQLLKRSNIDIEGKECVVIGRSNIVGKPMAMLLLRENGTVTITHSRTKDLKEITKRADILVAAIGKPKFVTAEYVKEGAVVIDVGIHRNENNKLCGDVDFDDVIGKVNAITPVPGGVGPMTIAMLMNNCVETVRQ